MGYWIAVHETRGTALTTSDEPGMCSQRHKIIQPWIFRALSRVKVHAIPGVQKDEVRHHELSHQAWTQKRSTGTPVRGEGSLGPPWTWALLAPGDSDKPCVCPCLLKPGILLEVRTVSAGQDSAVSYQWASWMWSCCKGGPELISPAD